MLPDTSGTAAAPGAPPLSTPQRNAAASAPAPGASPLSTPRSNTAAQAPWAPPPPAPQRNTAAVAKTAPAAAPATPSPEADDPLLRARESFWTYCTLINPAFYREDRPHLRRLCDTLQAFIEGTLPAPDGTPCTRLCISLPPRHGKSYTMCLFNQWRFGREPSERIINVSYNELLSARFSKAVRDGISAKRVERPQAGGGPMAFSDVFPGVRIRPGDGAAQLWSLQNQYFSFLGTGFGGTVTGVGCTLLIIDDPIKNHLEAYNPQRLDEQWEYYVNTLLSRVEEGGRVILVMTRWALGDLAGRAMAAEPGKWVCVRQSACLDERAGRMLCPSLLSFESWRQKRELMARDIFEANFQNEPIDRQGRLYEGFCTYDVLPPGGTRVSYTDTADTGADFLCCILAQVVEGRAYVLDVIYTDEPMEKTEKWVAEAHFTHQIDDAVVESNNGGRGFARNVEKILWQVYHTRRTRVLCRQQRQNKESRILTQAPFVQRSVLFPTDWHTRWPRYYAAMSGYMRKGRNPHDDAPDATTGLAEYVQYGAQIRRAFYSGKGARGAC